VRKSDLPVSPDDGTEQLPRAAAPVDAHHPQDLEEPEAAQCRRGEHLTAGAETQDDDACRDDDDICTHSPAIIRAQLHYNPAALLQQDRPRIVLATYWYAFTL